MERGGWRGSLGVSWSLLQAEVAQLQAEVAKVRGRGPFGGPWGAFGGGGGVSIGDMGGLGSQRDLGAPGGP